MINNYRSLTQIPYQTPDQIFGTGGSNGLRLWVNSDRSAFTTASTSNYYNSPSFSYFSTINVSQWNDISGQGRHLIQGTNNNRPSLPVTGNPSFTPNLNGKRVVRFYEPTNLGAQSHNTNTDQMTVTALASATTMPFMWNGTSPYYLCIIFKVWTIPFQNGGYIFSDWRASGQSAQNHFRVQLYGTNSNNLYIGYGVGNSPNTTYANMYSTISMVTPVGSLVIGRWNILEVLVKPTNTLQNRGTLYFNDGVNYYQQNNTVTPDRTFLSGVANGVLPAKIAQRADAGPNPASVDIEVAELILANVEATPFRLATIRNYYAQEWGLKYY